MEINKTALLVVYNHRYDNNIPLVEKLYNERFANIYHLVPFYDGNTENVIPVYESSYQFQSFISQAYQHLKHKNFTHYFIIADDLVLNPNINEQNLLEKLEVKADECWLPTDFIVLQEKHYGLWPHIFNGLTFKTSSHGAEVSSILPDINYAESKFRQQRLPTGKIPLKVFIPWYRSNLRVNGQNIIQNLLAVIFGRKLSYPLVGGYSDTFLVTADTMPAFAKYCGAFAATNLFVELAIPTSMVLSADKLKIGNNEQVADNTKGKGLEKYAYSLPALLNSFPDCQYLHPIKLSKWKF